MTRAVRLAVAIFLAIVVGVRVGRADGRVRVVVLDDVARLDLQGLPLENLDRVAARGVTFTRAYAAPVCSPARRALLFGRWTHVTAGPPCGDSAGTEPPVAATSLAELVSPTPVALFGKWHLGGDPFGGPWQLAPQVGHGFAIWRAGLAANVKSCEGTNYNSWLRVEDGASFLDVTYHPDAMLASYLAWSSPPRGADVVFYATQLAHAPFHTPPAHLLPPGYPTLGLSTRGKYEAMIVAADHQVGTILDGDGVVGGIDLAVDWLIVVGDNGTPENILPAPYQGKGKGTTYERGINVPLVVAGPGFAPGVVSDVLVHAVDVYATIAVALGHPVQGDGVPLQDSQFGGGHDYVLCGTTGGDSGEAPTFDLCVRTSDGVKLRRTQDGDQLFDLNVDPFEVNDRFADPTYAGEVAKLTPILDEFQAGSSARVRVAATPLVPVRQAR